MSSRVTSKQVTCPTCGAPPGEPCRGSVYGSSRGRSVQSHTRRVEAAEPTPQSPPGVYALTEQDAADINAVLDMPEQPVRDWTGVAEEDPGA